MWNTGQQSKYITPYKGRSIATLPPHPRMRFPIFIQSRASSSVDVRSQLADWLQPAERTSLFFASLPHRLLFSSPAVPSGNLSIPVLLSLPLPSTPLHWPRSSPPPLCGRPTVPFACSPWAVSAAPPSPPLPPFAALAARVGALDPRPPFVGLGPPLASFPLHV